MLNVGRLLKSIPNLNENATAAVPFVNWLAQSCDPDTLVTPDLISQFFQEALAYPHWQQNRRSLSEDVRELLQAACLQLDEVFEFTDVVQPQQIQIFEIESLTQWVDVINSWMSLHTRPPDRFRLLHDELTKQVLAVTLRVNGGLTVQSFSRQFFIRQGALTPLREDLVLHYNANLELESDVLQKIVTGPFMTTAFRVLENRYYGSTARGFQFQPYQSLEGGDLHQWPQLFYALKRTEQHLLKRESDPYYQELVATLEHAVTMLRRHDEEFIQKAPDLLSQGLNGLEHVFVGDKLLGLLLRDLQQTMGETSRPQAPNSRPPTAVRQVKEESPWNPNSARVSPSVASTSAPTQALQPTPQNQQIRLSPHRLPDLTN